MNKLMKLLFSVLITALFFVGCATSPDQAPPSSVEGPLSSKIDEAAIQKGDQLAISITGITPEIHRPQEEVNELGNISLPHINTVKAEGLTVGVLQKKIERAYLDGGYYTKLSVSITPGPRILFIQGEVRMPGKVLWSPGLTVGKAISLAGGFTDYANRSQVEVTRKGNSFPVNLKAAEADPSKDVQVFPRDDIKVNRSLL
jgi:polysaccharide biosynthesis/export protein VpsN